MGRFVFWSVFAILLAIIYIPISLLWRESTAVPARAPLNGEYIATIDGAVFTQTLGFREQPPVVFVGGPDAWSEIWKPSMRHLAREGYRAIAIDLPPFGLTPAPTSRNYTRPAQAQRLKKAIDNLQLKDVILVAHSHMVPAALTATHLLGRRAKGLVIVSPELGWPEVKGGVIKPPHPWLVKMLRHNLTRKYLAALFTHDWAVRYFLKGRMVQTQRLTEAKLKIYQAQFDFKGTNRKIADWLAELVLSKDRRLVTDQAFFKRLRPATLILSGGADKRVPAWQTEQLKTWIPKAQLTVFPKVGHIPQLEYESAFSDSLLRFVRTIEKPVKL